MHGARPFYGGGPHQRNGGTRGTLTRASPLLFGDGVPPYPEHPILLSFGEFHLFGASPKNLRNPSKNVRDLHMLNLDAMSVPEALVHRIRILVAPAVFVAH